VRERESECGVGWGGGGWIQLKADRIQWLHSVNTTGSKTESSLIRE
jgi:hypothetical protein